MARANVRHRAAQALVEALYVGDARAAAKWGVSTRTIQRYRRLMDTDSRVAEAVARLRRDDERNWSADIGRALRMGIDRLIRYLDAIDTPTEQQVREIRETIAVLAEIATVREVLERDDEGHRAGGVIETTARALPPPGDQAN